MRPFFKTLAKHFAIIFGTITVLNLLAGVYLKIHKNRTK